MRRRARTPPSPARALALSAPLCGLLAALAYGCASEDLPKFGDPTCTPGGCGAVQSGVTAATSTATSTTGPGGTGGGGGTGGTAGSTTATTGTGGTCVVNTKCAVHFKADIFGTIFNDASCLHGSGCHDAATAGGNFVLGNALTSYDNMKSFTVSAKNGHAGGPYIVPCDVAASKMLCNMLPPNGTNINKYGQCGAGMPSTLLASAVPPTAAQLDAIAAWIKCGAPFN